MTGRAKSKVVTSGRLIGPVQMSGTIMIPSPGPAARPEPVYSLYSTDSEDQVTTLHKGLDHCAALLSGILQVDKEVSPGHPTTFKRATTKSRPPPSMTKKTIKKLPTKTASAGLPRAVKGGAAKSRSSISQGKMTINKLAKKTDQHGPGSLTPRTHRSTVQAPHSGVKLHPPQKRALQMHNLNLEHLSSAVPPHQTAIASLQPEKSFPPSLHLPASPSDYQPVSEASHSHRIAECDREEELEPVRDVNIQSSATDSHTAVGHRHINACNLKMTNLQLEPGQAAKAPADTRSREECCAETEAKAKTAVHLLGELKALIAGQGSVAERLLSHLEQTVSSHTQLCRCGTIQNEQLKEREKLEKCQKPEILCNSEVQRLREELVTVQSRLQEHQDDVTELRKALQDSQSRLWDMEAENALMKTDLEASRRRLLESEKEKSDLASIAQKRLEEIGNLKRLSQIQCSANDHSSVENTSSVTNPRSSQRHPRMDPAEPSTDRIDQYLMSLSQVEPTLTEHVCTSPEREANMREQSDPLSRRQVCPQQSDEPSGTLAHQQNLNLHQPSCDGIQSCGRQLERASRQLFNCDVESLWSNWSMHSGSTFDTKDEAAFRDGLAALDASIASLQKTIQLDLRK
ncbi:uncharacterized protein ccdc14 isoform 2-T2 [Odontesthes bonariensis]|uniref:uncharacterized protein ccdc14 isoform X2 n=1 Tax=Odontesthes bonariensis TaxID=219752 RepID=UPI003F586D3A